MTIEENFADYHARIKAAGANAQVKDYFKAGYLFGAAANSHGAAAETEDNALLTFYREAHRIEIEESSKLREEATALVDYLARLERTAEEVDRLAYNLRNVLYAVPTPPDHIPDVRDMIPAPIPLAQEDDPVAWAAHDSEDGFDFISGWPELVNEHINEAIADGACNLPYRIVPLYARPPANDGLRKAAEEICAWEGYTLLWPKIQNLRAELDKKL